MASQALESLCIPAMWASAHVTADLPKRAAIQEGRLVEYKQTAQTAFQNSAQYRCRVRVRRVFRPTERAAPDSQMLWLTEALEDACIELDGSKAVQGKEEEKEETLYDGYMITVL